MDLVIGRLGGQILYASLGSSSSTAPHSGPLPDSLLTTLNGAISERLSSSNKALLNGMASRGTNIYESSDNATSLLFLLVSPFPLSFAPELLESVKRAFLQLFFSSPDMMGRLSLDTVEIEAFDEVYTTLRDSVESRALSTDVTFERLKCKSRF